MPAKPPVISDMRMVLAPFRMNVERVLRDMRSRSLDPVVFETWRSPERADWLVAQSRFASGRRSMHCYGLAVDIISQRDKWSDRAFFEALGAVAESHGLTWGGRFSTYDGPHIQAIPIFLQDDVRRCDTDREREKLALGYLSAVP